MCVAVGPICMLDESLTWQAHPGSARIDCPAACTGTMLPATLLKGWRRELRQRQRLRHGRHEGPCRHARARRPIQTVAQPARRALQARVRHEDAHQAVAPGQQRLLARLEVLQAAWCRQTLARGAPAQTRPRAFAYTTSC